MKKTLIILLVLMLMLSCQTGLIPVSGSDIDTGSKAAARAHELAPINRDAVTERLIADGKLPGNATQDQVIQALKNYIGGVNTGYVPDYFEKRRQSLLKELTEENLLNASFRGNKLGQSKKNKLEPAVEIGDSSPLKTVRVLVVLAEYQDLRHNMIPQPLKPTATYWTSDFSREHYQNLLFGDGFYTTPEGIKSPTFKEYFKEQSNGNLAVEGTVLGWYQVSKNAAYYGGDSEDGSVNDVNARDFIREAVSQAVAANSSFNFSDYDIEDPYDLDDDGNLFEPDGIIDHLMVIHSGMGQEEGAPSDAIWSHSSSLETPESVGPIQINAYTTEPENGAVGVFAHEFTHDLGIPDDYDTAYSADGDIVEYWSIMGGGSWSGTPGGTMPTGINPWSRFQLGLLHGGKWINWEYAKLNDIQSASYKVLDTASMNTGNTQAVIIEVPSSDNYLVVNQPSAGTGEFFGGRKSDTDAIMTLKNIDLTAKTTAALQYDIWFDIEYGYDAGSVEVSEDGTNWTKLAAGKMTSISNFYGGQPVYTGENKTWSTETIDLSAYAGKVISLRFRYKTDAGLEMEGMFIDNVQLTANGETIISEGAENGFGSIENYRGTWSISDGIRRGNRYYMAEWRSYIGVDEGLQYNARACVKYNRGMLLWYVNQLYSDNWVGFHPGYGQLGVVDANQYVYLNSGLGNGNEYGSRAGYMPFIQLHDAAFSLEKAPDMDLSIYGWAKNPNLAGKQAVPLFDDSSSWFSTKSPYSGLILPNLGLRLRVVGNADDYSRGEILIGR